MSTVLTDTVVLTRRSLRHVLSMMIDYFESAGTREAA